MGERRLLVSLTHPKRVWGRGGGASVRRMVQRTAVVTGTSSGLGLLTATRLAGLGWNVLGTVRRPIEGLPFETVVMDVTDDAAVTVLGDHVNQRWGRLDALVNNAGYGLGGPVEELTGDELRRQLDVNTVAPLMLARACLPSLRAAGGAIVQVSSVSGYSASALFSAYNASKFALEGASEALRDEVVPQGVRVVLVEPGPFRTEIAGKSPQAAARGSTGLYAEGWREIDEWLQWHATASTEPDECVDAIVRAVTDPAVPFRIPVGAGIAQVLRDRAADLTQQADAAEAYLAGQGPALDG